MRSTELACHTRKYMKSKKITEKYLAEYVKKHYPRKRQFKIGSVASLALFAIAAGAITLVEILAILSEGLKGISPSVTWYPEARGKKYLSLAQLSGRLYNLEKGGYIKKERVEGKQTLCLTKKGIQEILKFKMRNKYLEKSWDKKWRLIVFDIKEITRKDRDYLRRQLKWIGFQELQKSVWVFPYEIRDDLREFIKLCRFEFQGDVRFILADKIEPDLLLRKKFNLS